MGDSLSSSSPISSPEQSPTALSPPKDHSKISQKQSSSTKPSDSNASTSPSLSKPKSVTSSRSQSTEDLPIASTLSRSRSRNKLQNPIASTSSGSSTSATSQKRSQKELTKRDQLSADINKEQKTSTSNEKDDTSPTKFNKTRLRRSNSSIPLGSDSSPKSLDSKSIEEDTDKEGKQQIYIIQIRL